MFDTKNDSACGFGDEIIAYLYGEMDEAERNTFEEHLETCARCPEDLSGFSSVSMAINEWKSAQFDPLAMPEQIVSDDVWSSRSVVEAAPLSAFERLRELFSNISGIWQTASAFAVIALTAGLVWFVFGGLLKSSEIAAVPPVNVKKTEPAELPDVARSEPSVPPESSGNGGAVDKAPELLTTGNSRNASSRNPSNRRVVIKSERTSPRKKTVKPNTKNRTPDIQVPATLPAVPRLTELAESDDTEDGGLRLSELFAGSGSEDR